MQSETAEYSKDAEMRGGHCSYSLPRSTECYAPCRQFDGIL